MAKKYKPTIAVDFDGVIHAYRQGWHDGTIYDIANPGSREALQSFIDKGFRVVIYTSRANSRAGRALVIEWLNSHNLPYHDVTSLKPLAVAYIDDRAVRFYHWTQALNDIKNLGITNE